MEELLALKNPLAQSERAALREATPNAIGLSYAQTGVRSETTQIGRALETGWRWPAAPTRIISGAIVLQSVLHVAFLPFTYLQLCLSMASLNTSTNGPSIKSSYQGVVNSAAPSGPAASSPTYGQWAVFSVSAPLVNAFQQDSGGKESVLKVQSTGGKAKSCPSRL
jgi:hypothetical protein